MTEHRIVVFLVDGMGDVGLPQLQGLTPLQVAHTPFLDALARAPLLTQGLVFCFLVRNGCSLA